MPKIYKLSRIMVLSIMIWNQIFKIEKIVDICIKFQVQLALNETRMTKNLFWPVFTVSSGTLLIPSNINYFRYREITLDTLDTLDT